MMFGLMTKRGMLTIISETDNGIRLDVQYAKMDSDMGYDNVVYI